MKSTGAQQAASEGGGKVWRSILQDLEKSSADGDDIQSHGVPPAVEQASEEIGESQEKYEVVVELDKKSRSN